MKSLKTLSEVEIETLLTVENLMRYQYYGAFYFSRVMLMPSKVIIILMIINPSFSATKGYNDIEWNSMQDRIVNLWKRFGLELIMDKWRESKVARTRKGVNFDGIFPWG